ncbi:MAG: hypothetical protein EPO10_19740 [Reyranella sp.]|uniref:hypothetical protein n=1 Tax=Reyranella sp. TaxID=1929291 RepID=UPI0011FE8218|nr:hypothetical protein [Reyranella sp.]TAJ97358.1 MAG: hypothetical protein EPO41_02830 [Reyranella sp.]TBR27124.1 MAG: hypothetical protein EPO10_19740 [Reyranella sp.]
MADAFDTTPPRQVADTEGSGAANAEVTPTIGPRDEPAAPEAGAEAAAEAPADYSGLRLPEGYRADDPVFGEATKLFGSEKIAPETAQKLIDFTVERDREIARAVNDHAASSWTKQTTEWRATSEKEFSPEALGNARTALAKVFDRQTIAYLEGLGFTNHPGLIRGMVKVASTIKDDSFVGGNAGRGTGTMDPKALYPNSQHN